MRRHVPAVYGHIGALGARSEWLVEREFEHFRSRVN